MVYFTSDLHLGHRGIIEMQQRPFSNVEEMNRCLLEHYNSVVQTNDTVYLLGDLCHHLPVPQANEWIRRMKGKKILVRGNHDKIYDEGLFEEICDFKTISCDGIYFALMHYPMLSWPKKKAEASIFTVTFTQERNTIGKIGRMGSEDMMSAWTPTLIIRYRLSRLWSFLKVRRAGKDAGALPAPARRSPWPMSSRR